MDSGSAMALLAAARPEEASPFFGRDWFSLQFLVGFCSGPEGASAGASGVGPQGLGGRVRFWQRLFCGRPGGVSHESGFYIMMSKW